MVRSVAFPVAVNRFSAESLRLELWRTRQTETGNQVGSFLLMSRSFELIRSRTTHQYWKCRNVKLIELKNLKGVVVELLLVVAEVLVVEAEVVVAEVVVVEIVVLISEVEVTEVVAAFVLLMVFVVVIDILFKRIAELVKSSTIWQYSNSSPI